MKVILKNKFTNMAVILVTAFFVSCDFTPRLYQDILLAQEYVTDQKYQKAVSKYESILSENPSDEVKVKIYYQLGELYSIHLHNTEKAINYYSMIKDIFPDPLWLVRTEERIADAYFSFGEQYKKSAESYQMLVRFVPRLKNFDLYQYRLALSYFHDNQLDKAQEVFETISQNHEQSYFAKSYYYLGLISFQKKNWSRSVAYWNEYIQLEKRRDEIVKTKFMMANAYETMEKLKEAYNIYYSLLGEYPNTDVIQARLNSIYERKIARKR